MNILAYQKLTPLVKTTSLFSSFTDQWPKIRGKKCLTTIVSSLCITTNSPPLPFSLLVDGGPLLAYLSVSVSGVKTQKNQRCACGCALDCKKINRAR